MPLPTRFRIHVRNWEKFQHPDTLRRPAAPPWIKVYTALLSDDAYRSLTLARAGILHGIWIEYARSRGDLRTTTRDLSNRLNGRVTAADLQALEEAGFIVIEDTEIVF